MASVEDNGVEEEGGPLSQDLQITVTHLGQDDPVSLDESGEPSMKRPRLSGASNPEEPDMSEDLSVRQILFNINKAICLRLDSIENKLESVSMTTRYLEEKVEQICNQIRQNGNLVLNSAALKGGHQVNRRGSNAVIVGLPQERNQITGFGGQLDGINGQSSRGKITVQIDDGPGEYGPGMDPSIQSLGPNVQLITLNTEDDFPQGTWMGDENNPEMRVRVPITASDLLHVHSNCRTPEKMALTLLDYLFDRETQASSNLSGMGKHGKRQLDPLMIYGIRCHLIYRFGITEQDWHRIKQNIDSKCRTAWRRKVKGLPLTVKAFRGKAPPTYVHMGVGSELVTSDDSLTEDSELHIHQGEVDLAGGVMHPASAAEIIQSAGGEIQVLHATPEQVAQLQQAHQIQILQGDATQLMLQGLEGQDGIQVAVSMGQPDGIHVVTTETGEQIHVQGDVMGDDRSIGDMQPDPDQGP